MFRLAFKNIRHRPLRLLLTFLAIALSVSFISGTYIFTNSVGNAFDTLFSEAYGGADVSVQMPQESGRDGEARPPLDDSVRASVAQIEGVRDVAGTIEGSAQIFTTDGVPLAAPGAAPNLVFNWVENADLNVVELVEGNAPTAPDEVAIDGGVRDSKGVSIGDTILLQEDDGTREFTVTGIVQFGEDNALLGAALTFFTDEAARSIVGYDGEQWSSLAVDAADGVEAGDLRDTIAAALPDTLEVTTADEQIQAQLDAIGPALNFINIAVLAFGYIAVAVGAFIIYNTFQVIIAQRTREFGLLRAIGSSGKQLTGTILLESLLLALVASAVGVPLGFVMARVISAIFESTDFALPSGALSLTVAGVVASVITGVLVTMLAALIPAIRAAKISPMEALRESATGAKKPLRVRSIIGFAVLGVGALLIFVGVFTGIPNGWVFTLLGALGVVGGTALAAAAFVRPFVTFFGWPIRRFARISGRLASRSLIGDPRRTSVTGTALMVGVALVTLIATFVASVEDTIDTFLEDFFPADFIVQAQRGNFNPFLTLPSGAAAAIAGTDGVGVASAYGVIEAKVEGQSTLVVFFQEDTIEETLDLQASPAFESVGDGVFVTEARAARNPLGSSVTIEGPDGSVSLEVVGTVKDATNGEYLISESIAGDLMADFAYAGVSVKIVDGESADNVRASLEESLQGFPAAEIQSASDLGNFVKGMMNNILNLFTALLALAVIIAVFGIVNTLMLSISERTHEIGLLRAVGTKVKQVRAMITFEGVLTSCFGGFLGIILGVILAWALIMSLRDEGFNSFAIPWVNIGFYAAGAILAGVVAAIWPAIHASRIDILKAVATE